ncbi:hypothetical protein PAMP_016127 [Pampus punctatissimus]
MSFKMLCTTPSLYRVLEAEGSVRAKSSVDLVVRHLDVSPRNWGRRDRFRLEVRGGGQVGGREIWAELRRGEGGGWEDKEERRMRKKRVEKRRGQQRVLLPLLVHTHTHTCSCPPAQVFVCHQRSSTPGAACRFWTKVKIQQTTGALLWFCTALSQVNRGQHSQPTFIGDRLV